MRKKLKRENFFINLTAFLDYKGKGSRAELARTSGIDKNQLSRILSSKGTTLAGCINLFNALPKDAPNTLDDMFMAPRKFISEFCNSGS